MKKYIYLDSVNNQVLQNVLCVIVSHVYPCAVLNWGRLHNSALPVSCPQLLYPMTSVCYVPFAMDFINCILQNLFFKNMNNFINTEVLTDYMSQSTELRLLLVELNFIFKFWIYHKIHHSWEKQLRMPSACSLFLTDMVQPSKYKMV